MRAIDIANMAIGYLGGNRITSLEDESEEAELIQVYYESARDFCLESRAWTFAAKRAELAPLAEAPAFGWSAAFLLPADTMVVREVSRLSTMSYPEEYEREADTLLANASSLYIKYTTNWIHETKWSKQFCIAVAHKLAEFMCGPITENRALKKDLALLSEAYLEVGGATDGMQASPRQAKAYRLKRARYTGRMGLGGSI